MNEAWMRITKAYIESYEAIQTLKRNNVIDEEFCEELKVGLLENIIDTFKSEVEADD